MGTVLIFILAAVLGIFCLYIFIRLSSYAILRSIDDIKRKRKEKKHGSKG